MPVNFGSDDDFLSASTMHGRDWPCLRQFVVILENRVGSLGELLRRLERSDMRIIALSMVDTVEVAVARVMVDQFERAREIFEMSGFTFFEHDVVGVELPDDDQPFASVLTALVHGEINVNYMYPLIYRRRGRGAVAIHVSDIESAQSVLRDSGHVLLTENDLNADDIGLGS